MQMQCKIIKSMKPDEMENAVNNWLVDNPRVEVCHIAATAQAGAGHMMTIILYRSDEEQAKVPPWNVGLRESKV